MDEYKLIAFYDNGNIEKDKFDYIGDAKRVFNEFITRPDLLDGLREISVVNEHGLVIKAKYF